MTEGNVSICQLIAVGPAFTIEETVCDQPARIHRPSIDRCDGLAIAVVDVTPVDQQMGPDCSLTLTDNRP